ncbi:MAG: hypothetical protein R3E84_05165 [Pseudomonadales bacterium]
MAHDLIAISPRKRSARDWHQLVKAYRERSCTREVFCRRHGVAVSTLDWWRRKLDRDSASSPTPGTEAPAELNFIDLSASPADHHGWGVELDLGGGMVLRLRRA